MQSINIDRHSIAAYIPTKNCAELLDKCLSHLSWIDEIIVGDASTNDEIEVLLATKHPKVKYLFDKTDDWRLRFKNHLPQIESDFILRVDTDEFYTSELGQEILEAIRKPCEYEGFEIPSISYCYGACLGEGATQLRLFLKDKFSLEMKNIHEMPKVKGNTRKLFQAYHHVNNPILGISAVKAFRYEANNSQLLSDEILSSLSLENVSSFSLHKSVFENLIRLNWRFLKSYWHYRKLGFAGLCFGYCSIFGVIASHISPTEQERIRKKSNQNDFNDRGYFID